VSDALAADSLPIDHEAFGGNLVHHRELPPVESFFDPAPGEGLVASGVRFVR
jgi:hypothetical protein